MESSGGGLTFDYYGPKFQEIENVTLCQGQGSLRENFPTRVDRRVYSLDENERGEYKEEMEKREKESSDPLEKFDIGMGCFPIAPKNAGHKYEVDESGIIVTRFDVAYEGVPSDGPRNFMVGDRAYRTAQDLGDAIRRDQAEFTEVRRVVIPGIDSRVIDISRE